MMKTIILFLFSLIAAQTAFGQVTHRDDKKILNAERSLKVEIELNSHEEFADNNTPERQIKIYDVVEQQPSFPGGNGALMKWLESHIKYPAEALDACVQGRVVVSFVVEPDGTLSNVQVIRGIHPSMDAEAVRVCYEMPLWNPGRQNGVEVRVKYNLPIQFRLPKPEK